MKRLFLVILVALLLLTAVSCSKEESKKLILSGEIIGISPDTFCIIMSEGKEYGILYTDATDIVWNSEVDFSAVYGENAPNGSGCLEFGLSLEVDCGEPVGEDTLKELFEIVTSTTPEFYYANKITVTDIGAWQPEQGFGKPVIYLYPEEKTDVTVTLDFGGELVCTYPKSDGIWRVTAQPDGTLTDEKGTEYNYLFWEGESAFEFDFSKGFCVKGEDTAKFLETALAQLGLTRPEANEFIVYWLPLMEVNEYNVISFQGENYEEHAKLTVEPKPDTVIRVYMAWYGTEEEIKIEPQELTAPEREGFAVIEWGGTEVK